MYQNIPQSTSLLSKLADLKGTIKWAELLEGTKKTLDIVNQAIPIYYQIKPIVSNAKTLFKIANVVNSNDQSIEDNSQNKDEVQKKEEVVSSSNNSPIFYL